LYVCFTTNLGTVFEKLFRKDYLILLWNAVEDFAPELCIQFRSLALLIARGMAVFMALVVIATADDLALGLPLVINDSNDFL